MTSPQSEKDHYRKSYEKLYDFYRKKYRRADKKGKEKFQNELQQKTFISLKLYPNLFAKIEKPKRNVSST